MQIAETIETITSVDEIDTAIKKLREKKRMLKKTNKVAERKVSTLARRRERLMEHVRRIEEQIEELRRDISAEVVTSPVARRRGRPPRSAGVVGE